jgi:pyrroloquinoline quinone (PQQ) biosynthesis protein C
MTNAFELPWYAALSAKARQKFLQIGQVVTVDAGVTLIAKDAVETHLFLLEEGEVEVRRADGTAVPIGRGELIGEMAFLNNAPRRASVVASSPSRVRRIERLELMTALASEPDELRAVLDAITRLCEIRMAEAKGRGETPAGFVARLAEESLRHRAVHHPYLEFLAAGRYPDSRWALADFARHYYGYSSHFPRYLTTVISRLENPAHRRALLENLTEESGVYGDEEYEELARCGIERDWIQGIPHPMLFQRFSQAIGVAREGERESDQVVCWREMFLAVLADGTAAEALGALGLGTENIVRTIYGPFVRTILRISDLRPRDTVFFPLHTAVDDHHQATLQAVSADFASSDEGRADLRRGMLKALTLRCTFWDWLHARALDPARAQEVI